MEKWFPNHPFPSSITIARLPDFVEAEDTETRKRKKRKAVETTNKAP